MVRLTVAWMAALGVVAAARASSADISPPEGFAWARDVRVSIVNLDRFSDYVFVAWPCDPAELSLAAPYCVIQDTSPYSLQGSLYAIANKGAELRRAATGSSGDDTRRRPSSQGLVPNVVIVRPAIADPQTFFPRDPRVLRPGFDLRPNWISAFPANTGATSAIYDLEIQGVGPDGVKAQFVRARYTCTNGGTSELAWEPGRPEPPVPRCPALDDRGEFMATDNDAAASPTGTAFPRRSYPNSAVAPFGTRLTPWVGGLLLSLALIGLGLTIRRDRGSAASSVPRA